MSVKELLLSVRLTIIPSDVRLYREAILYLRVDLLSFATSQHTEATGQGSYCAEIGFKGTEPRTH